MLLRHGHTAYLVTVSHQAPIAISIYEKIDMLTEELPKIDYLQVVIANWSHDYSLPAECPGADRKK